MKYNLINIHKPRFRDIWKLCTFYGSLPIQIRELFHPFPYCRNRLFLYIGWVVLSSHIFPLLKRVIPRLSYYMLVTLDSENEEVLGFIFMFLTGKEADGLVANVGIITREDAQGKGIGSKMYKDLIKISKENGVIKFRVTVMERNVPSTEQVKKLGYVCKGYTQYDYWKNKKERNLVWELDLR